MYSTISLLFPIVYLFVPAFAQTCYFPDGSTADLFKPCTNYSKGAACCYSSDPQGTDLCYNNGYCYSLIFGALYRGACTDRDWSLGSACAQQCLKFHSNAEIAIVLCNDGKLCCGHAEEASPCCEANSGFDWNNATFLALENGVNTIVATYTERTTIVSTKTATETNLATSTCASEEGLMISKQESSQRQMVMGAGLGSVLGISVLAVLVMGTLLLRQRRQRISAEAENKTEGLVAPELQHQLQPQQQQQQQAELRISRVGLEYKAEMPSTGISELPSVGEMQELDVSHLRSR
ncbi:hypothetical protein K402DRAFT_399544 [Aulographum hederae CBS 113979]|uniref:Mid2 domain-containing protein n=1 Tax=Aulographum hederae CBS 113979 TaxID=1176131 RepID=A0A6G1HHC2_9PEZI|nr:hypothetical protein K402DRAFT_399544 [Aulographum hederae CBS 113979]